MWTGSVTRLPAVVLISPEHLSVQAAGLESFWVEAETDWWPQHYHRVPFAVPYLCQSCCHSWMRFRENYAWDGQALPLHV